jgi:hypothetical protein
VAAAEASKEHVTKRINGSAGTAVHQLSAQST